MPERPVAIVAGSGALPAEIVDHLRATGRPHRVLALRGFADAAIRRRADRVCGLLDPEAIFGILAAWSPSAVTLAGGVARPGPAALLGAYGAFRRRREIAAVLAKGDDGLLRAAVAALEERGHRVVGAQELAPHLLAPAGFRAGRAPTPEERAEIAAGAAILEALAPFDVGQAVAIAGERVLALEGPEGTDRMLRRVADLRRSWFRRGEAGGVLVKAMKRGQDSRVDMPAIGPRTVLEAARAGLSGIAVAAGATLILDRPATVAAAARHGLFLASFDPAAEREKT